MRSPWPEDRKINTMDVILAQEDFDRGLSLIDISHFLSDTLHVV